MLLHHWNVSAKSVFEVFCYRLVLEAPILISDSVIWWNKTRKPIPLEKKKRTLVSVGPEPPWSQFGEFKTSVRNSK